MNARQRCGGVDLCGNEVAYAAVGSLGAPCGVEIMIPKTFWRFSVGTKYTVSGVARDAVPRSAHPPVLCGGFTLYLKLLGIRSEERRVGKGCKTGGAPCNEEGEEWTRSGDW